MKKKDMETPVSRHLYFLKSGLGINLIGVVL